ncbi:MAG: hypothetical protein H7326_10400, partial [Bdellovibrionaceae bacterium]|nr:hypothetical protein [Pseudobdellovibrionaceae bacterium]
KAKTYQSGDYYGASYKLSGLKEYGNLYGMMRTTGVVRNNGGAAPICSLVLTAR